VNRLLERCAALLGKEAALFLPSGTMCNLVATKLHTEPGDVLLAEGASHVLRVESGGAGMVSGVMTEPITGSPGVPPGTFTVDDLDATLDRLAHLPFPYAPPARLVCIEQTHNMGGGTVWPWETFAAVTAGARGRSTAGGGRATRGVPVGAPRDSRASPAPGGRRGNRRPTSCSSSPLPAAPRRHSSSSAARGAASAWGRSARAFARSPTWTS